MKLIKGLLAFAIVSLIAVSCDETKKGAEQDVKDAVESVQDAAGDATKEAADKAVDEAIDSVKAGAEKVIDSAKAMADNAVKKCNQVGCMHYTSNNNDLAIKSNCHAYSVIDECIKHSESEKTSALDVQVGGGHYKNFKIQPIEFIHANNLSFCQGNIIKYVTRHRRKGEGKKDIEKVIHYAEMILEMEYKDE